MLNMNWKDWLPQSVAIFTVFAGMMTRQPYEYYQFIRWSCLISFGYLTIRNLEYDSNLFALAFALLAAVYNPIVQVHLHRPVWVVVNSATIIIAVYSIFYKKINEGKYTSRATNRIFSALSITMIGSLILGWRLPQIIRSQDWIALLTGIFFAYVVLSIAWWYLRSLRDVPSSEWYGSQFTLGRCCYCDSENVSLENGIMTCESCGAGLYSN
ncbi:DUF6804 family protein [Mangrovitalea sediminis]|uniref:DUF6804 family protein n=1 Tax=Mangrovitalea sediminis TaxID=1982043 RepID=UPI0011775887|nr:DUF6804 family protein [Mangrovitalea sediminis]